MLLVNTEASGFVLLLNETPSVSLEEAKKLFRLHKVEKFPIVGADGKLKGLVTIKDIKKCTDFPQATKDEKGRLRVGAAIGVKGDFIERAQALLDAHVDVLVLDIAHGHSDHAIEATRILKPKGHLVVLTSSAADTYNLRSI